MGESGKILDGNDSSRSKNEDKKDVVLVGFHAKSCMRDDFSLIRHCRHWRISHAKSCMQIPNVTQLVGLFRSFVQSDAKSLRVHRDAQLEAAGV